MRDSYLFSNDKKNKKQRSYNFCTKEEDELNGRVPMNQNKCNCGKSK